jgi:hypothetical protein
MTKFKSSLPATITGVLLTLVFVTPVVAQSDATRKLYTQVVGYELNEAAAKDALAAGGDINWKNDAMSGETMLITAIKGFKDAKVIKFLLEHGADRNIKDESGKTALDWARQYNIGRNQNGRDILALLEGAAKEEKPNAGADTRPNNNPTPTNTTAATTPTAKPPRRTSGPPTVADVKWTMEQSFGGIYESHFYGVKNKVTFEWAGPITVGALQAVRAAPKPCYPVKLKVTVTAEDPRDGNRSTVTRGLESTAGNYKEEIFCFYRDGFGEWAYGTYGK